MKDTNQNKQDCELFLRAFEKPTQIYRYLQMRRLFSPSFLQRNLSYLRGRSTKRKITKRSPKKSFDWKAFKQRLKSHKTNDLHDSHLTLKFLGYFDEKIVDDTISATIDIYLLSQNKTQPKLLLQSIPVEINPTIVLSWTSITFSKEQLTRYTTKNDRTSMLHIEVSCIENQNTNNNGNERSQRPKKRKKVSHDAKLPVFDKLGRCDLLDGEYELNLDVVTKMTPVRMIDRWTWATNIPKVLAGDKRYFKNRSLKFIAQWNSDDGTKSKSASPIHSETGTTLSGVVVSETGTTADWGDVRTGSTTSLSTSSGILSDMSCCCDDAEITAITTKKLPNNTLPNVLTNRSPFVELINIGSHLLYRFIYNDNLSQKTEAMDEFLCPWCYLDCRSLHPLMMHLRLCHDRFKFTYTQKEDGIQVDVSINERYNCALSPLKEQVQQTAECKEQRPYKRKPYTKVLVSRQRAKKQKSCTTFEELDEAIASDIHSSDAEEDKFMVRRNELYFDGHNRCYSRTTNNMLYTHRADFDEDSEGEMDPGWLREHTKKLIEDFSDVNDGEKEMLKMWNLHVMKYNFVAYSQMALACEMFVNEHGDEILQKNLYRNFMLHLTNLHDYDMLTSGQMFAIVQRLQAKQGTNMPMMQTSATFN